MVSKLGWRPRDFQRRTGGIWKDGEICAGRIFENVKKSDEKQRTEKHIERVATRLERALEIEDEKKQSDAKRAKKMERKTDVVAKPLAIKDAPEGAVESSPKRAKLKEKGEKRPADVSVEKLDP